MMNGVTIGEALELIGRLNKAKEKGDLLEVIMPSGKAFGDTTREELDELAGELVAMAGEFVGMADKLNGVSSEL